MIPDVNFFATFTSSIYLYAYILANFIDNFINSF